MDINWFANIGMGQGYSGSSEQTAIALDKRDDVDVTLVGFENKAPAKLLSKEGIALQSKEFKLAEVGIAHGFPNAFSSLMHNKFKVGYTMFETDTLPAGHNKWTGPFDHASQAINEQLDLLLVPAQWNVHNFRDNGVRIPIEVVPNGINPAQFPYIDRPKRETFTFLMLGTLTHRKNPGMVIAAFSALFKDKPDVRLIMKTQSGTLGHLQFPGMSMGKIEIIDDLATPEEVLELYAKSDCFLFPTRGEGFGMPPIEAMATGLPTIFSNHTGMMDYANPEYNYPVHLSHKAPAIKFPKDWGYVGNWYEPDFEHLKELMWYVYTHQEEARNKGKIASEVMHRNYTYDVVADKIVNAIRKYNN